MAEINEKVRQLEQDVQELKNAVFGKKEENLLGEEAPVKSFGPEDEQEEEGKDTSDKVKEAAGTGDQNEVEQNAGSQE